MRGKRVVWIVAVGLLLALVAGLTLAQGSQTRAEGVSEGDVGTAFTYQGLLRKAGAPVDGACDLQFSLWDAGSDGNQIGDTLSRSNVAVSKGLFTIPDLDFGQGAFQGNARYLEVAVHCAGDPPGYTPLAPRQALTPAPYALALPGLWTQQNMTSTNLIGGYSGNWVADGVYGATISGGGTSGGPNRVTDVGGTVGGGEGNQAGSDDGSPDDHPLNTVAGGVANLAWGKLAAVGGGFDNVAIESCTTVGGGCSNRADGDYSTVAGGDANLADGQACSVGGGSSNTASTAYATVSGGISNTASADGATVSGGWSNTASEQYTVIGGGQANVVSAPYGTIAGGGWTEWDNPATANRVTDVRGTVGGGGNNQAGDGDANGGNAVGATVAGGEGNTASAPAATVGGGVLNTAGAGQATVGGGGTNTAGGSGATVAGGQVNTAAGEVSTVGGGQENNSGGGWSTIGGGRMNTTAGEVSTVGGGSENSAEGFAATVGGGQSNSASGEQSVIAGGFENSASGRWATVGGGVSNTAGGSHSTVPGGDQNRAAGDNSFAAGHRAIADHKGAFVWADGWDYDLVSSADFSFNARATGGFYLWTGLDGIGNPNIGAVLYPGSSAWSPLSDRDLKANVTAVDTAQLLASLARVPVTTWNYTTQDPAIRHIGPMAQDFYAAFGVGEDERHISTVDADGVALAAVQGLYQQNQALTAENAAQQAQIDALEARLAALEAGGSHAPTRGAAMPAGWLLLGGGLVAAAVVVGRSRRGGER